MSHIVLFVDGVAVYDNGQVVTPPPPVVPGQPPAPQPPAQPPAGAPYKEYQSDDFDLPAQWTFGGDKPDGKGWNFSMTCIDGTPMFRKVGRVEFSVDGVALAGGATIEFSENYANGLHTVSIGAHPYVRRVRLTAQ